MNSYIFFFKFKIKNKNRIKSKNDTMPFLYILIYCMVFKGTHLKKSKDSNKKNI